jgi:anti-sigma B factor antagonist
MPSVRLLPRTVSRLADTIALEGEFDLTNIALVKDAFEEAAAAAPRALVVDLSAVEYLDSTMLAFLVDVHRRLQLGDGQLLLVRPIPTVWRVFEITHLDRILRSFETRDAALAAAPRAATTGIS